MKRIFLWIALPALFVSGVHAQQKFSMAEATTGQWTKFLPESRNFVQWKTNAAFTYIDAGYSALYQCSEGDKWQPVKLLETAQLQSAVNALPDPEKASMKLLYFPYEYSWTDNGLLFLKAATQEGTLYFEYDVKSAGIVRSVKVPADAAESYISAMHDKAAFTRGDNVYIVDEQGKETVVTATAEDGIVNGSSYVHRQEFGIDRGIWWSPDGKRLAFYQKDETRVQKYPLVNTAARMAEETPVRYPMAGMTSENVSLFVFDTQNGRSTRMETGIQLDHYLTSVSWDPSSQALYIGILNRGQDHLQMKRYDAVSEKSLHSCSKKKPLPM